MTSKGDIIRDVYIDRAGFGSRARTLKEAREKDKTILEILTSFLRIMSNRRENLLVRIVSSPPIPRMSIRWTCFLLMIWRNKNLR